MNQGMALHTDLYQLTMGLGYWHHGRAEEESVFHLFFRKAPFGGGRALCAGLEPALRYLEGLRFEEADLLYLGCLEGSDGQPLFPESFLAYLGGLRFTCDVDAIGEGEVVFPNEPLVRIRGPLFQAQLVETALLNIINFQTLVATKAARICEAADGDPVLEFGLRRAQGPDGGLSGARAAYLGGCVGTSNVRAGKVHGIPVRGTHAHSWVMSFPDEARSFEAYAEALPSNTLLLVDTYDTEKGVRKAIETGRRLRERGHDLLGVRLDSGDLVKLSRAARELLDEAGFPEAKVVASNDLDEYRIKKLKDQGAAIDVWGVGTRLATCYDQPALGGVYKLGALLGADGEWIDCVKRSGDAVKSSNPGILQVERTEEGDLIRDERDPCSTAPSGRQLLQPVLREGSRVGEVPDLPALREKALREWSKIKETHPVELDPRVADRKRRVLERMDGLS